MAKTRTKPTPKRRPKAAAARPDRPTGRRLNLRIRHRDYDDMCAMAIEDELTVTAWLVRQIQREHERRDSLACAGEVRR